MFSGNANTSSSNRVKIISLDVLKQKVNVKEENTDVINSFANKIILKKSEMVSKENVTNVSKTCPRVVIDKRSLRERMEKFFNMKASDLSKPKAIEFACEKPLKTPKDTLRCPACNKLYARMNHEQHKKECSMKAEHKYGCVLCQYKHTDIQELQKHINSCHKPKKTN